MIVCKNCGHRNDDNAQFCQNCGRSLRSAEGMATTTKILIVAVIILVLILGLVAGMYLMKNQTVPANNTSIVVNQSAPTNASAQWHMVANFTGVNNANSTFNTKGKQFKVVMSATPLKTNTSRYMTTNITNGNTILATGTLSWPNNQVTTSEKTLQVTASPGTYYVYIYTRDLQGWTITIYDYY